MSSEPSIFLFDRCPAGLDRKRLRTFHRQLEKEVARAHFNCLLTRDEKLHAWNLAFRKKDYPTDVLSFPLPQADFLGEVAISVDRAAAQAAEFRHTLEEEIQILMLHGALHLIGMDHERDGGAMARAEAKWRKYFGLPLGLTERARKRSA
ncbi:MAG: rRNA maturation RNase YbeY [Bryobacteraceae bacterium]|nr:rRNA maturation RNase YbeY [Bryobacteraceae bacterium]MDW8377225.1 rRNA maturation RNase YbeY [Bryobacterales bacterium]